MAVNENDQRVTTHRFSFSTDVNECFYEELNACSEKELCLNVDGSYQCVCHEEPPTSFPQKLNRTCEGEMARTHLRNLSRLHGPQTTEILFRCKEGMAGSWAQGHHSVLQVALDLIAGHSRIHSWV